jgi:hypothetical protein
MPSLNRRPTSLSGSSGRCSMPRLKRGRCQRVASRARPWPKRLTRRSRGGRGLLPRPSSKPCSACSGAVGCSEDVVIVGSFPSCRAAPSRLALRSAMGPITQWPTCPPCNRLDAKRLRRNRRSRRPPRSPGRSGAPRALPAITGRAAALRDARGRLASDGPRHRVGVARGADCTPPRMEHRRI